MSNEALHFTNVTVKLILLQAARSRQIVRACRELNCRKVSESPEKTHTCTRLSTYRERLPLYVSLCPRNPRKGRGDARRCIVAAARKEGRKAESGCANRYLHTKSRTPILCKAAERPNVLIISAFKNSDEFGRIIGGPKQRLTMTVEKIVNHQ